MSSIIAFICTFSFCTASTLSLSNVDKALIEYARFVASSDLKSTEKAQLERDSVAIWQHYGITWNTSDDLAAFEHLKKVVNGRTPKELLQLVHYCRVAEANKHLDSYNLTEHELESLGLAYSALPQAPEFYIEPTQEKVAGLEQAVGTEEGDCCLSKVQMFNEPQTEEHGSDKSFKIGDSTTLELVWLGELNGWVGKYEITNAQYRIFDKNHSSGIAEAKFFRGLPLDRADQPVVLVSFHQANEYCLWLNQLLGDHIPHGYSFRLPNRDEWLIYSRGSGSRIYPWGNTWPPVYGNYLDEGSFIDDNSSLQALSVIKGYDDGYKVSAPVFASGKNSLGLYGIGGNIREFTCEIVNGNSLLRGGSWGSSDKMSCLDSHPLRTDLKDIFTGFRVVLMSDEGTTKQVNK